MTTLPMELDTVNADFPQMPCLVTLNDEEMARKTINRTGVISRLPMVPYPVPFSARDFDNMDIRQEFENHWYPPSDLTNADESDIKEIGDRKQYLATAKKIFDDTNRLNKKISIWNMLIKNCMGNMGDLEWDEFYYTNGVYYGIPPIYNDIHRVNNCGGFISTVRTTGHIEGCFTCHVLGENKSCPHLMEIQMISCSNCGPISCISAE
jgi:hypothetical protein